MAESKFSAELGAMGCSVITVKGSVNNLEDVEDAIKKAPCPIRGVFHFFMVQMDSPLLDMTWKYWKDASEPKSGQGNYKAGCTFIESFCQNRHSLGLPAFVLSIRSIEDIGYLAENPSSLLSSKRQGLHHVREKEFLESVEASPFISTPGGRSSTSDSFESLSSGELSPWKNNGHIIMGLRSHLHFDDPKNPTNWRRDRRLGAYHNLSTGDQADTRGDSSQLKFFL
ncbi:hypothetical protein BFJ66_g9199 [Fusarium oxysporum f. sp. cepae]|uniref:Ketoreductase domain-containing protein n=1 Tax=Fusarium oxysporum f. sp. cepae TaxID=396571 RepID=A0A3L6N401_FUSOX|nr:hypothetical protein BFJ65_g13540 [Fusarium oxysporum f. sp. cepae]RKK45133.1 hypothetical protein BFJ66_g9199 [Fusarium oxysporum f. sp. cepae]